MESDITSITTIYTVTYISFTMYVYHNLYVYHCPVIFHVYICIVILCNQWKPNFLKRTINYYTYKHKMCHESLATTFFGCISSVCSSMRTLEKQSFSGNNSNMILFQIDIKGIRKITNYFIPYHNSTFSYIFS